MEPTAAKKIKKNQRLRTIHDELSRHDDMLRTHYPKRCPTYLVAFSLKETYDDLATAQQMICKRSTPEHSPQESTNSITPNGSFKILETEADETKRTNSITPNRSFKILETELDESNIIAKNPSSSEHSPQVSTNSITPTGSLKTLDTELKVSKKIAKNKPESPEHSPQESTNSITPTGSFKTLETELKESKKIAKNKPASPEHSQSESTNSITPTGSFKTLETELKESNKIAKNKSESPENSPQESTNSITPAGSFKILETEREESKKIANTKPESPERSPQQNTNSITPTGSYKLLETQLEESKKIAKNKSESPKHSPQESTNSITSTGSFKLLEIELDKSKFDYTVAEINNDNRMRKNSHDSITPKNSLNVLETKWSPISNKNSHSKNKPVSIENSVHSNISSTNSSSTPTSSHMFSSSDYSTASRITIGEKQKVTIDFTAFETNSEEPSTTECNDTPENAMKCEVVPQEKKEVRQSLEKIEKYITVYVYDESDNKSDKDNTGNTVNTSDSGNTGEIDNKSNNEEVSFVSDKITDNTSQENRNNIKEPESIFKAVTKSRAPKKKRSFRRKNKNAVNIKEKKFKCKFTKKKLDIRLEKYYEKRNNSIDADQIQLDLYSDEVSTVVSRTQVVHKKARENLLKNSDINIFVSELDDERSLTSSPSTARGTLMSVSDSSQNTLVQEPSTISNVTDILDMITVNQDIEVDHVSSLLKMPNVNDIYKSEVVSIPVTVAYDRSTISGSRKENHLLTSQETSEEIYTFVKLPLTSCEGVLPLIANAVTKINEPSSDIFDNVTIKPSSKTLINMNSSFAQHSHDDFYNARTSSQFSKCIDSFSTLTNDRNTVIDVESTTEDSVLEKEAMIFETVINLERSDAETPSTSSNSPSSYDLPYFNDIIVANVPNDKHQNNHSIEKDSIRKTILSKTTEQRTEKVSNKMLNLPNQMEIKAMLREREMPQLKCGDEVRNPPNVPPLWERLMSALEIAVHRLEDNLVEKIMREIQKPIVKYPEPNPHSPELTSKAEQAVTTADCENLSVQCDLVKSTTIDKIMGILSSEGPKIKDPITLNKVDLYNDIEVIISPDTTRNLTEKGDQITISTLTSDSLKLHHRLSWLASVPVSFIRENMLVITSVPTFFVFLLCIYSLIQFVMKPW